MRKLELSRLADLLAVHLSELSDQEPSTKWSDHDRGLRTQLVLFNLRTHPVIQCEPVLTFLIFKLL